MRARTRGFLMVAAFLSLSGVVGAACGGGGFGASGTEPAAPTPAEEGAVPGDLTGTGGARGGEATADDLGAGDAFASASQVSSVGPRIVKTGSVTIEVREGRFAERFRQAVDVAARHGGFVASSQTSGGRRAAGTIVVRVPAEQFESTLAELKGLGTVKAEQLSGEDVTARFVDLEARLRNWEAQESVLLRLMDQARTIDDSIKVQRALQDVQLNIEQIRGQLRYLSDQTEFSTITASIAEVGAVAGPPPQGTLARAWHDAVEGFVQVVAAIVVGLGYLAPLALIGAMGAGIWMLARRGRAGADVRA